MQKTMLWLKVTEMAGALFALIYSKARRDML
jgi:hypothetical protein